MKTCPKCNLEKPEYDFSWRARKSAYDKICKKCNTATHGGLVRRLRQLFPTPHKDTWRKKTPKG